MRYNRRTATKVKNGRVQRKHRETVTVLQGYVLDRQSPGRGFRHVVTKRDVQAFIDIIPQWHLFSPRLERIVLSAPSEGHDGEYAFYHRERTGGIFLDAWPEDLWTEMTSDYFESHLGIFTRLGVAWEKLKDGVLCRFTEAQARAFVLLHVFMHELGHHYDRLNQKSVHRTRGEDFAERFAIERFNELFPKYVEVFGDPRRGH